MINYKCPNCKHILNIPDEYANTTGKCKHCGKDIRVPGISWRAKFDGGIKDLCRVGCGGFILLFIIAIGMSVITSERPASKGKSSQTTLTHQPKSPPPPISSLTFSEIRSNHERMTDVQWDSYSRSLKGKRVSWSGWISDVTESYSGRYRVLVDMDSPNAILSVFDVKFEVPTNIAMKLTKDNSITFVGTIKNASTFILSMDINLENVTIMPSNLTRHTRPPSMIDGMLAKPKPYRDTQFDKAQESLNKASKHWEKAQEGFKEMDRQIKQLTPIPRFNTSNTEVFITRSGGKYHNAGCSYLKGPSKRISLNEAKQKGFQPCKRCIHN